MMKEDNFEANLGGEIGLSDGDKRNWFRRMKKRDFNAYQREGRCPGRFMDKMPRMQIYLHNQ